MYTPALHDELMEELEMHDGRPIKQNSRRPFPNSPSLPQTRLGATRPFPTLQPRPLPLGKISIAVAVSTRCDSGITIHSDLALKAGATKQEVAEALGVAMAMNAGATLVYSLRALDSVDARSQKS